MPRKDESEAVGTAPPSIRRAAQHRARSGGHAAAGRPQPAAAFSVLTPTSEPYGAGIQAAACPGRRRRKADEDAAWHATQGRERSGRHSAAEHPASRATPCSQRRACRRWTTPASCRSSNSRRPRKHRGWGNGSTPLPQRCRQGVWPKAEGSQRPQARGLHPSRGVVQHTTRTAESPPRSCSCIGSGARCPGAHAVLSWLSTRALARLRRSFLYQSTWMRMPNPRMDSFTAIVWPAAFLPRSTSARIVLNITRVLGLRYQLTPSV